MKEERSLTFPSYIAMQIKKQKSNSLAEKIFSNIYTDQGQKILTNATSLAPVTSQAYTSDKQASNARLWAASADMPIPSLSEAAFTSTEKRTSFTNAIREYLSK